ncbi:uncharacterized protein FFB20_10400 [Fusarium fujikuroi]|nr:uncharacterized protein FFB20_10400 [Fusarium fujikuroi]SCO11044.1 uncharacterized protein FFC1_11346 [Fusarium fujikuroi]SCO18203.1 uncharacterized protein FFM5_11778 [Fusarium fujikuroi]SCO40871.1 uncharacterized protein FFNC_07732 [Fusarium fujikuroi]SCO55359.1 uncharacterized protein FFMR_12515 [Fusarium fujikuroi]
MDFTSSNRVTETITVGGQDLLKVAERLSDAVTVHAGCGFKIAQSSVIG